LPERLARFFTAEPGGSAYRIHKGIRDILVFSEQDVIKDPPFSKLDLISCRNLLIYMGGELQKKLIPLFHYALNPGGFLFLGTSETVGEFPDLFAALDRKAKLYHRKEDVFGAYHPAMNRLFLTRIKEGIVRRKTVQIPGETKLPLRRPGLRVKTNGEYTAVHLTVQPVAAGPADAAPALFLVVLEKKADQEYPPQDRAPERLA